MGGTIQSVKISGLLKAIANDNALSDPSDQTPLSLKGSTMNALVPILEKGHAVVYHPQGLDYTEEYCVNKLIAFDLIRAVNSPTDSKARYFRPKKSIDITDKCDENGNPQIDYNSVTKVMNKLRGLAKKSMVSGKIIARIIDDNIPEMAETLPKLSIRG